ncbi:MAG: rod shape-determining protein MreC [Xanthomonadales bacterium]|nr:rod shape-determining protein MreC [Xanthomonadales bacterium]
MARLSPSGSTRLFSPEGLRTARLMVYLLLSVVLMAMDQRGQYVPRIRAALQTMLEPVYHLVGLPSRIAGTVSDYSRSYSELSKENRALQDALLRQSAAVQQLESLRQENRRLRALLDATEGRGFEFRFAEMVQVNLDPYSHQVIIDRGASDGVTTGQAVLDGAGVMGQVGEVHLHMSDVLLISDPDHALPVQLARTGLRTVAYGTGETAWLSLPNVPLQADVRPGDLLVTSGLGDRFPAGFPVAEVESINRDSGETFAEVRARPLAALDRGREVLLVLPVAAPAEPDAIDTEGVPDDQGATDAGVEAVANDEDTP